jgi:hypothetical protein
MSKRRRPVPNGLNFLLLGVARSGTTAVTEALNCAPGIFCGMEALPAADTCARVKFPESFEALVPKLSGVHGSMLRRLLDEKRHTAYLIGNKDPQYYGTLRALTSASPYLKLIFIYRSPTGFLNSWNRRAADHADDWHPGQTGVFGVLCLLAYLRQLQRIQTDCVLVSYDAFSRAVADTVKDLAVHFLGQDPGEAHDAERLARLQSVADGLAGRRLVMLPNEAALLEALRIDELNGIMNASHLASFSCIRSAVRGYWRSIRGRWGEALLEAVAGYDKPAAIRYLLKMLRQPAIAELFAEEAAISPRVAAELRRLPRHLKLRRLLLRQCSDALCADYLARMRNAVTAV